jgi:PglZ domain
MHPLHDYIADQLAKRLNDRRILVWYDVRSEFAPFIAELRDGKAATPGLAIPITVAGTAAHLVEHAGSFFEVRATVEPLVEGDVPERVLVYVAGVEHVPKESVLLELETMGACYTPSLKRLAKEVLRRRYTDGTIDEILAPERVGYEDLARALSDQPGSEPPSVLKAIFHEQAGYAPLLAAWLASPARDAEIDAKEAKRELQKLVQVRLGLTLPPTDALDKMRAVTKRYVLGSEYRADLRCPPPTALDSVPVPAGKEALAAVQEVARRLRAAHADVYAALADQVEGELGLTAVRIPPSALGSTDTFRFEERALLLHCGELLAEGRYAEALAVVAERRHSFWLDRDVIRKAHWEACRRMADLGALAVSVRAAARKMEGDARAWVEAYTAKDGWYRLDQAQRQLETWVANLTEDAEERPLGVVRRAYDDACAALADGFSRALLKSQWSIPGILHQTHIHADVTAQQPKPVAYFLVDAMRFEMGVELAERLPGNAEVVTRPAVGALPSITPIGMAALLPGASSSFSVVEAGGKLAAKIDDARLPDLASRRKLMAARAPGVVDLTLDELLGLQASKLVKRVEGATLVVVRSQEIDHAGETGFTYQARQVMDGVIDNLGRAIRKLAAAGVEHSVVTADHGHLFFPTDRDASMRIDAPGGATVELHRRCWIGRGGTAPYGARRARAADLGYDSDLDFIFPSGSGVFKAGGDLAYHHGGTSLQEMVIPVVTVRFKLKSSKRLEASPITVPEAPEAITNRIFSIKLHLGGKNLDLFGVSMKVRPVLVSGGKQVGTAGMATEAELDLATGCVVLTPGKVATVAFRLSDDKVSSLRVMVQDPATDAELYSSPADIPIRLST